MNDTGTILQYDLHHQQIRWNRKVDYTQTAIDPYDHALIQTSGNLTSCLNNDTGENLWSARNAISYVNSDRGIAVGVKFAKNDGLTNTFEGYDLKTGKLLWDRIINREYKVNEISRLNDSVILISSNGLHSINLKYGDGWDYDAQTGMKDYSATVATNLINIAFSVLLETDPEITTGHDLITDIVSNTLTESTGVYLADNKSIVRIDARGNVVWKSKLPRGLVSRSTLFIKDSLICMVNDGFASLNDAPIHYGKPFIAGFNKNTGKRVFLSPVGYKKEQILSYDIQQDTLYLLSADRAFKYSMRDGTEFWEQPFKTDSVGELTQFGKTEMFVLSDPDFIRPVLSHPTERVVFNSKNQLLVLNSQLEIIKTFPSDRICSCYLMTTKYKFIGVGENTIVTDKNNHVVALLDLSGDAVLIGTKLFESIGNSLIEIDMNDLR